MLLDKIAVGIKLYDSGKFLKNRSMDIVGYTIAVPAIVRYYILLNPLKSKPSNVVRKGYQLSHLY